MGCNGPGLALPSVCSDLLSSSRTSRFYNKLVETGKAYSANAVASYPGEKHSNALVLFGQPGNGVSLQQLDAAIKSELQGLVHSGPNPKEMARIKKVILPCHAHQSLYMQ